MSSHITVKKQTIDLVIDLRHELHTHPELSNEEVWTKARLLEFLKKNTKNLIIHDRKTWFYAVYKCPGVVDGKLNGKPVENIAFRADFDALPMDEYIKIPWASKIAGKAHKCGHDGHSATMMAFAMEVDQKGAPNNIFFLWQPAEEIGSGALQCVPMLTEENIARIFGYHNLQGFPLGSINIIDGVIQCASTGMIIKFTGSAAHASQPETGKNPSFAIANLIQSIPELTKKSKHLLLCTIVQVNVGNRQFGMSAYYGELLMTIRATYEKELEVLRTTLVKMAEDSAKAEGLQVAFEYSDAFPETSNDADCANRVRAVAKAKGFELKEMDVALRPSEDFGHYGKVCPAAFFFVGNGVDYPSIHTPNYDYPDAILPTAVEVFKGLAGMTNEQSASL